MYIQEFRKRSLKFKVTISKVMSYNWLILHESVFIFFDAKYHTFHCTR